MERCSVKRLRKIISPMMVLLILFSNLQLPYLNNKANTQVYATENDSNILLSANPMSGMASSTVTATVYDEDAVALDEAWLTDELLLSGNSNLSSVTDNVYLPENGPNGSTISWESTDETVVTLNGTVMRPNHTEGDKQVTLTATIFKGDIEDDKIFNVIVKAMEPVDIALALKYDGNNAFLGAGDTLNFNGDPPGTSSITELEEFSGLSAVCLTLSPNHNPEDSESGNVFTKNKIHLGDKMSFSTYFKFLIRPTFEALGEGFTFTLQADGNDVLTNHGPSMGTLNIKPSVSVEFDTRSWNDTSEIDGEHTAVFLNGNYDLPIAIAPLGYNSIARGEYFHVWIEYDGASETMELRISPTEDRPIDAIMAVDDLDLESVFITDEGDKIQDIYAGFTANNNLWFKQEHYITEWLFKNDSVPINVVENAYREASLVSLGANPTTDKTESTVTASVFDYVPDDNDIPLEGIKVDFSTSFGSLDVDSVITDADGKAEVILSSDISGRAVVKAIAQGGTLSTMEVQIDNPQGDTTRDKALLTDDVILNGNSNLDNVIGDLAMPKLGQYGSTISWKSSDEDVVRLDGTVTRPSYVQGDKEITLTATISKDGIQEAKVFNIIVKSLHQTEGESVSADKEWLTVFRTLGTNSSQYGINNSLELPLIAPNGSLITWESSMTTVISNDGKVNRPEYPNHKSVTMTATLKKGDIQDNKEFVYTVIAEMDSEAPYIIDTVPKDNSKDIIYDNRQITVTFNENMRQGKDWDKIKVGYFEMVREGSQNWVQKFIEVESLSRLDNGKLIVTLSNDMKSLRYYKLTIPQNAITDLSDNSMSNEFSFMYKVEMIETGELKLLNSNPFNRQENISAEIDQISFSYSATDIFEGSNFNDISMSNSVGEEISVLREINEDTVNLSLDSGTSLELGEVYTINIPLGSVQDRFKRNNKSEIIQFKTRVEDIVPKIINAYPSSEKYGVNVNQSVDISFSEKVKVDYSRVALLDDKGNRVPAKTFLYNDYKGMIIDPIKALKPQTKYTVLLPKDSICDYSDNYLEAEYKIYFTTGANLLNMNIVNISSMQEDVSLDAPVQIQFSEPITPGLEFANIKVWDSQGSSVPFQTQELGNNVILNIEDALKVSETYIIDIPSGAYQDENNNTNDALKIKFITAAPLEIKGGKFIENQSLYYLIDSPVIFSVEGFEKEFYRMGREITSYEWRFSDGSKGNDKKVERTYTEAGSYEVTLDIIDNKGVSYEYKESVTIVEPGDVNVSISPDWQKQVIKSDNSETNFITYTIEMPTTAVPVVGNMKATLYTVYDDGYKHRRKTFNNIEISNTGITDFNLDYNDLSAYGELWSYELVFEYEEWGKTKKINRSFRVHDKSRARLRIVLYDMETGSRIDPWQWPEIEVKVDGEIKTAEWAWLLDGRGYEIKDISSGPHEVQVFPPNNYYPSDKKTMTISAGRGDTTLIELEPLRDSHRPKLRYIKSPYTDSRDSKPKIFIDTFQNTIDLNFTIEGDWNNCEPGYVELKTTSGKDILTKKMEGNTVNALVKYFGWYTKSGDRILARMVSKNGTTSPWVDAKLLMAPTIDGVYAYFQNNSGEYFVRTNVSIKEFLAGKIPVLEDIPLINNANSFGIDSGYLELDGKMDNNGRIELVSKKNERRVNSLGYTVGASLSGGEAYQYYPSLNQWKFAQGDITIIGTGGYTWKRNIDIPGISKIPGIKKLNVGGYGKLILKADAGGTFIITEDVQGKTDYKGILYFVPDAEIVVGAGNSAVNIEGYGGGKVATQVHIPTGYVQVDPSLRVGIRAKFLIFEGDIYSKKAKTSWNNGKEKIPVIMGRSMSKTLIGALDTENIQLTPMSREYINQSSEWLAGSERNVEEPLLVAREISPLMMSDILSYDSRDIEETNPQIEIMMNNIYPDAEVKLVKNGDELWMIWTDDNPDRSPMNRTQMRYSVLEDGTWSEPIWIGQDGTGDFSPVSASTGNGVLMAWQNIKEIMPEDTELGTFIENGEISVTESVYKSGCSDVQIVMLTDDDKFDHSPKLAADGNNALLVWTKSEGMGFEDIEVPENSDSLLFSKWNGSTWSDPKEIANSLPTVMNSSLVMNQNEGLLLYTLDMTDDDSMSQHQEIFARIYDGSSWTNGIQVTENQVPASNPKAVYSNGKWFITWYEDGRIMYKEGLDGETKTAEFLSKVEYDYDMVVNKGTNPQIALVYKQSGGSGIKTLSTSFYHIEKGIWSDEIPLTEGEGYVRSVSPIFTDDGKLNVAYTQAEVVMEVIEGMEYKKPSDIVDLCTLTYTPIHDIALDEIDGLQLSYENPVPGTIVTVTVNIRNQGDFPENTTLYLYDGNPKEGGSKIGEVSTIQPIPARSSAQVEVEWFVSVEERERYDIYAVIDPNNVILEANEDNNTIKREIVSAEIKVTALECENIAKDDYLITAILANRGSIDLEGIKVYLDHDLSGQPLETIDLEELKQGQEVTVTFVLSSAGLAKDENGEINMRVTALLPDDMEESNLDNNTYAFRLKPTPIVVDSMNPGLGEAQVSIQQPITLRFNMNVEGGGEFDKIILEDEFLNTVDISKTLEGNTLTVTPRTPMAYNTNYTLKIPSEAISDSYGHTMDSSYSLNFVTTTSSPEIVFAYPSDGIGNVDLDTNIKMQFNQNVMEGSTLEGVELYRPGSEKISALVSVQGEWLYVNTDENLDKNTRYSLFIPAGAVQNDRGEVLQDDYLLEFGTGQAMENGNNDNDSGKEYSSKKSGINQSGYSITRQVLENGSSMAIVHVDEKSILKLKSDEREVVINVTEAVKDDRTIQLNLSGSALKQLITEQMGLKVITGKSDITLPAELIKSLIGEGENPIAITISQKEGVSNDNKRVSNVFDFSITVGDRQITEFEPEVIVTIPIQIARVGNVKRVIVCVYDEDTHIWQPVGGIADTVEESVTFNTGHFSTYAAFETIKYFDDVTSNWAKEKVEILASRRLIYGKTEKVFAPQDSVTRAEFTAMIVRSLYTDNSMNRDTFADVPKDAWFVDEVETAYEKGLINGSGDSKFNPNAQISREQLATIAYRLYQYKTGTENLYKMSNKFKDSHEISSYAKEAVNFVANAEIMIGSDGRFEPKRSATRQETAVVLYRLLEYMGEL